MRSQKESQMCFSVPEYVCDSALRGVIFVTARALQPLICPPQSVFCCSPLKSNPESGFWAAYSTDQHLWHNLPAGTEHLCHKVTQKHSKVRVTDHGQIWSLWKTSLLFTWLKWPLGILPNLNTCRSSTKGIWMHYFKGSSKVSLIMCLLTANPTLRVSITSKVNS